MDVDVWQESGWSPEAEEAPADEDESEEMERLWSGPSVPPLDLLSRGFESADQQCRCVLSIDVDCFYAQCETLRHPELAGKPVGVRQKNIVITCNYIGRSRGILKGDSIKVIRTKCPDITIINGEDLSFYRVISQRMFDVAADAVAQFEMAASGSLVHASDAKVEKMGMDEIFIDVTSAVEAHLAKSRCDSTFHGVLHGEGGGGEMCARLQAASFVCKEIRRAIFDKIGLTTSGGVSTSKLLSKMVVSMNKPNLQTVFVPTDRNLSLLLPADLPPRKVHGIGRSIASRLAEAGVTTLSQLRSLDSWPQASRMSSPPPLDSDPVSHHSATSTPPTIESIKALACGRDDSAVVRSPPPKSVAVEESYFGRLLTTIPAVLAELKLLALKMLIKVRQDEVFFGQREPSSLVVTTKAPSDVYWHGRVSKSGKLSYKVARIPRAKPPVSADELLDDDRALADHLAATGLKLFQKLHDGGRPIQVRVLNLGLKFGESDTGKGNSAISIKRYSESTFNAPMMTSGGLSSNGSVAALPVSASVKKRVSDYLETSRLAFIGSWKTRWRIFMRQLRKAPRVDSLFAKEVAAVPTTHHGTYFLHIDFDAFFVSTATLGHSELAAVPVAVVSGKGDTSEICSANYTARRKGLRSNMFVKSALEKCPTLKLIPVSSELFSVMTEKAEATMALLLQVSNGIRSLSCDEAFLRIGMEPDGTWDPLALASVIREGIARVTGGLSASIGIGHSTIAARFATTKAKPPGPGVIYLTKEDVMRALADASPRVLSGIGRSTIKKLETLGVETCADLLAVPSSTLRSRFGASQGTNLQTMARGDDIISTDSKAFDVWSDVDQVPATLQNEVNYNVRLASLSELDALLGILAEKLVDRLQDEELAAGAVTVKLSLRQPGAPEPVKAGGCGLCDVWSRSTPFGRPATTFGVLHSACCSLARQSPRPASDVRGVGVSLSRLQRIDRSTFTHSSRAEQSIPALLEKRMSKKRVVDTGTADSSTITVDAADVDEAVLEELPPDIQAEVRAQMLRAQRPMHKNKSRKISHFFQPVDERDSLASPDKTP